MLEGMLSDEYPNYKLTIDIISAFFDSLDKAAFDSVIGFVDKIINFRDKLVDKSFTKVMHSIFGALSIKSMCEIYHIAVKGDISDENFEAKNNLWLVHCT